MIGVIAEFSPFHNGHKYFLEQVKNIAQEQAIIVVMSGMYTQRGQKAVLSAVDRANIALKYGADLVIELPFFYATQSADYFAYGAVKLLNMFKVSQIICGSESNNLEKLIKITTNPIQNKNFQKTYGKLVINEQLKPNDILTYSYYKAIQQVNKQIKLTTIKRIGNFHHNQNNAKFKSASEIRELFKKQKFATIANYVPKETLEKLIENKLKTNDFDFEYLKRIIINFSAKQLEQLHQIDEGLGQLLKTKIKIASNLEELRNALKVKHLTVNKVNRMLLSIWLNYTKKDHVQLLNESLYLEVLGYNQKGQQILKSLKNKPQKTKKHYELINKLKYE